MEQLKTKLLVILSIGFISCQRTTKLEPLSNKKESEQTIYTEPDYNRFGYTEVEFTGEGSQAEMNNIVYVNLERAEKRLQTILDSIHILYNKEGAFWDPKLKNSFFNSLEQSQQHWESYYEMMVELKFPKEDEGGSSTGMSDASYRRKLIDQRIRDLNPWLMGHPQGDISEGTTRVLDYSISDIERSEKDR
jgi:hypothetical protein